MTTGLGTRLLPLHSEPKILESYPMTNCLAATGPAFPWMLIACAVALIGAGAGALMLRRRSVRGLGALALIPLLALGLLLGQSPTAAEAAAPQTAGTQCESAPTQSAPALPSTPAPTPTPTSTVPPVALGTVSGSVAFERGPDPRLEEFCGVYTFTEHGPAFIILSDSATGLVVQSVEIHDPDYSVTDLPLGTYAVTISGTALAAGAPASGATPPTGGSYVADECYLSENGGMMTSTYGFWNVIVPPAGTTVTLTQAVPDAVLNVSSNGHGGGA